MSIDEKNIVICGGGIIGISTAYYLTSLRPGLNVTVVSTARLRLKR